MNETLQHAKQTWGLASRAKKPKTQFVNALRVFPPRLSRNAHKDLFWSHTTMLADIFQNHALQQPEFQSLSPNEQMRLLKNNAPTCVLFLLIGYMNATDGLTQISWLLANKVPDDVRILRLMAVTPETLNAVIGLFSESDMNLFTNLIKDARLWSLDLDYKGSLLVCSMTAATQDSLEDLLTLSEWDHEVFWIGSRPHSLRHTIKVLETA
jgi:hypothetical protein